MTQEEKKLMEVAQTVGAISGMGGQYSASLSGWIARGLDGRDLLAMPVGELLEEIDAWREFQRVLETKEASRG